MDEGLEADLLQVPTELIILLLQVLDVLILDGELAHVLCDFILFLHQLFFVIRLDTLNFFLFLGEGVLGLFKLGNQIIVSRL